MIVWCTLLVAAAPFTDVTAAALGRSTDDPATDGWSNKVVLADINGDGAVDILVANGGDYETPGTPEMSFAYVNNGDGTFTDASVDDFGAPGLTRVIQVADVDGDGDLDIFVGGAWQTASRLLINDGAGHFTAGSVPDTLVSLGDAEFGDVDGDGDLDLVLADWGDGDPFNGVRGRPLLWLNDGTGVFTDATEGAFPTTKTGMSWDLELIDVDDDLDLDVLVSCKVCTDGGILLENQGDGTFLDRSELLPGAGNNYEFEAMDLDGDGDLDLVTVNDGPNLTERILINDINGPAHAFVDASDRIADNPENTDDNAALFLDVDNDGDADILIGSLSGADRVLLNDGTGHFTTSITATDGADTPGTLGIAVADLNGDHALDLVMVQGEQAFGDRVFTGAAVDTVAPFVSTPRLKDDAVYARVHDWKTPVAAHDFSEVTFVFESGAVPAVHVGEQLWRAQVPDVRAGGPVTTCATDAAGNHACSAALELPPHHPLDDVVLDNTGPFGCASSSMAPSAVGLVVLALARRRRGGPR